MSKLKFFKRYGLYTVKFYLVALCLFFISLMIIGDDVTTFNVPDAKEFIDHFWPVFFLLRLGVLLFIFWLLKHKYEGLVAKEVISERTAKADYRKLQFLFGGIYVFFELINLGVL